MHDIQPLRPHQQEILLKLVTPSYFFRGFILPCCIGVEFHSKAKVGEGVEGGDV